MQLGTFCARVIPIGIPYIPIGIDSHHKSTPRRVQFDAGIESYAMSYSGGMGDGGSGGGPGLNRGFSAPAQPAAWSTGPVTLPQSIATTAVQQSQQRQSSAVMPVEVLATLQATGMFAGQIKSRGAQTLREHGIVLIMQARFAPDDTKSVAESGRKLGPNWGVKYAVVLISR